MRYPASIDGPLARIRRTRDAVDGPALGTRRGGTPGGAATRSGIGEATAKEITPLSPGALAIYLGMFMITVDGSALNLALPRIGAELHGSLGGVQWVVNAYVIPLASLLLLAGSLGDRVGARTGFSVCTTGFTVASALCAASPNLALLIVARVLQGVFAAGMLPMVLALVMKAVPDPAARAKAVNNVAVFGGLALVSGPFIGGVLTDLVGWRWLFLANVPLGILTVRLTQTRLPRIPPLGMTRPDIVGQILAITGLTAFAGGIIEAGAHSWGSPTSWVPLLAGVIALALFVGVELRVAHPVMPMEIFRDVQFSAASVGGFAFQFGAYGIQLMLALFVERTWGLSPIAAAVVLLPYSAGAIVTTLIVNPSIMSRGPRFMMLLGGGLAVAGSVVALGTSADHRSLPFLLMGNGLIGFGTGIYSPSLNQVAVGAVPRARAGLASGVYNTFRQVGMAIGVAVLGMLATGGGARIGLAIGGACAAAIVVIAIAAVPRQAR